MRTYLMTQFDSKQSFHNKAVVEVNEDGALTLFSYETKVAEIKNGKVEVYNTQSNTTVRHIKEFLLQNGFKAETKKQIEFDYKI